LWGDGVDEASADAAEESTAMHRLILVLGGVRSGKSRFAQDLAERLGGDDVLFVATAEAGDDEMIRRIDHHRRSRPSPWRTLEQPLAAGEAIMNLDAVPPVILIDCLTLLVSNAMLHCDGNAEAAQQRVTAETQSLIDAARQREAAMIIVSGEVGLGLVPDNPLGRLFRDLLGWANQMIAAEANATYLMVAGLAVDVKSLATTVGQSASELTRQEF
jgi:adenosylcobinamide kinase / adenosylcobinamide-phosphate guanylyltransferase